jgi:hypothetical protein
MRTRGVKLADDRGPGAAGGVETRHQAGASGPDDDYIKLMVNRHELSWNVIREW